MNSGESREGLTREAGARLPVNNAPTVRRVRVHVPAKDGMPETVRGVGSAVTCATCGAVLRGRTHAEVRKSWRLHRLDGCA